jgi:polyphenol oxidase
MTLEIITADDMLATPHGFFTRKGGASSGIFAGLNCGPGSSDMAEAVQINRARVTDAMAVPPDALVTVHQVHSADVIAVTGPVSPRPHVDAMVTATPGVLLGVLTADCQPVLFHDAQAGVIGAAHAGWRGAKDGVLQATVAAMEGLGAQRSNIRAVIGPTISLAAYEVSAAFMQGFLDDDPANAQFFSGGRAGHAQFDLPSFGLAQLRAAGVAAARWTGHCTYRDAERFFSYRRTTHQGEADYGRLISVIRL